ncbi:DUF1146 family protein [Shouchella lonarensis]|uniref:DUF1146 family protein n=1 Tax=Shouchella lonarensis TaxID=1464122 RepID=UPI000B885B6C|nr:DUF1146 family protein [Shouchella lonarensis]
MTQGLGVEAFIHIMVSLLCFGLAWWALTSFRLELFVKDIKSKQALLLRLFMALALGYVVAQFILDYVQSARMLPYLLN